MARRYNELFIGTEFLNIEGRSIKHAGLISEFGNPNISKISVEPLKLIGMDLETDYLIAKLKLLGSWDGTTYYNYKQDFLAELFELVQSAFWKKGNNALAYWNKLDPFVLYKQFLILFGDTKQYKSMERYGKVSGEWNTKLGLWNIRPVVEVEVKKGERVFRFGIKNVMRSSIQFYFYEVVAGRPKQLLNESFPLSTIWAYDIAPMFKGSLGKEMEARKKDYPYYSKVSKDAHLVDWDRYATDEDYRVNIVDKSNYFDARAVYDLGTMILHQFKKAFYPFYPRNLIRSGSIARSAIVAKLNIKYYNEAGIDLDNIKGTEKAILKAADKLVFEDVKSIGIMSYYDIWSSQLDDNELKDMFCLFYEAYSGGYIEAILYGIIKNGAYSDIASAYIYWITKLMDLRGSTITHGKGEPPHIKNSYCVIRGTIKIPLEVNYMPITVKHVTLKDTNVRATGEYIGSYYLIERD